MEAPLISQIIGANLLADRARYGLFDEPGCGKTRQVIMALDKLQIQRAVIVAPAGVHKTATWQGEFKKWANLPRRVQKCRGIDDINLWLRGRVDVLCMSYEGMTKHHKRLHGDVIPAIIFDEAHRLKTSDSQRTMAAFGGRCDGQHGLARWGAYNWFLTGTPIPNDPVDVWPWLHYIGATPLNLKDFTAKYFTSRLTAFGSRQEVRPEMEAEFHQLMRAYSIRRLAEGLPPLHFTSLAIEGDNREVLALLRSYPGLEARIVQAAEEGDLSRLDAPHIETLRRLIGEAKAPPYVELLDYELKDGGKDKVVVMGLHRRGLDLIAAGLTDRGHYVVQIDGSVSDKARQANLHAFEHDPACRAIICNSKAAGEGLNGMQVAHHVDVFEEDWSPSNNYQAIKRVHRRGQKHTCRARFIALAGSLDEDVSAVTARKTAQIGRIEESIAA